MLIGTPEKEIEEIQKGAPDDLPEIINDLDDVGDDVALQGIMVFMTSLRVILIIFVRYFLGPLSYSLDNETHLKKIRQRVEKYQIQELNPPRPGSKLLVLDIDYTLFDHRSPAERASQLMRPYLHEFLTESYNKK